MAVRVNLDEPRWDQSTYTGRAQHFFSTTNPLNLLCSSADLDEAKELVTKYKWERYTNNNTNNILTELKCVNFYIINFIVLYFFWFVDPDFIYRHIILLTSPSRENKYF